MHPCSLCPPLQGSWICETSDGKSILTALRLICRPVGIWPDQSATYEEKEVVPVGGFQQWQKQEATTEEWLKNRLAQKKPRMALKVDTIANTECFRQNTS